MLVALIAVSGLNCKNASLWGLAESKWRHLLQPLPDPHITLDHSITASWYKPWVDFEVRMEENWSARRVRLRSGYFCVLVGCCWYFNLGFACFLLWLMLRVNAVFYFLQNLTSSLLHVYVVIDYYYIDMSVLPKNRQLKDNETTSRIRVTYVPYPH